MRALEPICGQPGPPLQSVAAASGCASVERDSTALSNIAAGVDDVVVAVGGRPLREVPEHLDAEPAIEVVDNPLFPRSPDDLCGQTPDRARLLHDVVGDSVRAGDELLSGQN